MNSKLFVPNPDRTFRKQVSFKVPTEDGNWTVAKVDVDFASVDKERLTDLQQGDDIDAYDEVVKGVHGVGDGQGGTLDAAKAVAAMGRESSFVYEAMVTFYDAMTGGNLKGGTSRKRQKRG